MDHAKLTIDLGEGVSMRPVRESDVDAVLDIVTRNYDHLRTFMEWAKPDYSRKDAEEWVSKSANRTNDDQPLNLCIFRDGRMIGTIGFVHFHATAARTEIGYWIDRNEQRKGIVSSACRLLIDYAFKELGMNKIEIRCSAKNKRSAAIPRRFGFKQEARLRQSEFRNGTMHDFLVFGLLRSEWEQVEK